MRTLYKLTDAGRARASRPLHTCSHRDAACVVVDTLPRYFTEDQAILVLYGALMDGKMGKYEREHGTAERWFYAMTRKYGAVTRV